MSDAEAEPDRGTTRMEAFSNAFFAVVITLLILELRPPELREGATNYLLWRHLGAMWPNAPLISSASSMSLSCG